MCNFNTKTATPLRVARVLRVATAKHAANKAAYCAAVQQVQAQYGISASAPRSNTNRAVHGASAVQGACAIVRGLVAANPQATRKQVLALAAAQGINPATAATQYAVAKRAQSN